MRGKREGSALVAQYPLDRDPEVRSGQRGLVAPVRGAIVTESARVWGETLEGHHFTLPLAVRVTSRGDADHPRQHHALVCHSLTPLVLRDWGTVFPNELRNLVTGRPLGASQATAVVKYGGVSSDGPGYCAALRAALVPPYFVRLRQLRNTGSLAA